MSRIRRIISLSVAFIFFAIAIATAGLWIRSKSIVDDLGRVRDTKTSEVIAIIDTSPGKIAFGYQHYISKSSSGEDSAATTTYWDFEHRHPNQYDTEEGSHHFAGFGYNVEDDSNSQVGRSLRNVAAYIPDWFVIAFCLAIAGLTLRKLRRPRPGRCRRCGYDLRATPDRCPECGDQQSNASR